MVSKEMIVAEFKEYIRTNTKSVMNIPMLTAKAAIWAQLVAKRAKYEEPDLYYRCGNHVSKTKEYYTKVIRKTYSEERLWRFVQYSFSGKNDEAMEQMVLSVVYGCPGIPIRSRASLLKLFEE